MFYKKNKTNTTSLLIVVMFVCVVILLPKIFNSSEYHVGIGKTDTETKQHELIVSLFSLRKVKYAVKAIYVSQCGATSAKLRAYIETLIKETELNSVIIDVKDYSGTIAFSTSRQDLDVEGGNGCKVRDMKEWLEHLHDLDIYLIARITVFQDPLYTKKYPEYAVHRKGATTTPWVDRHGLAFVDVGARKFWKYVVDIAKESHKLGFDELNFDYVRYPSDGNMRDVYYSHSGDENGIVKSRQEELEKFFRYLTSRLRADSELTQSHHVPILSADLFGMTTTNTDDLTIGQVLERAEPYFDYIAPMVYPSHYPEWFIGLENPNENVYEVVNYSISKAVDRMVATTTPNFSIKYNERVGTSTPVLYVKPASSPLKLRPWLQDFDYGGDYDATKVRAQIQYIVIGCLTSWMLWNPANKYTKEALLSN